MSGIVEDDFFGGGAAKGKSLLPDMMIEAVNRESSEGKGRIIPEEREHSR